MSPDDDGQLTFGICTDRRHGIIRIEFSHATDWIGLDLEAAKQLKDQLTQRIVELRAPV